MFNTTTVPLFLTPIRSFFVLHMVHSFQHSNPGTLQILTVETRPKKKAFQTPAFSWFTLNKTQLLLFNQIRISICSGDFPHPLLAKKVFLSPYHISIFKYILIEIPQTETMSTFFCKDLISWVNYHKEYKEKNSLNTSEYNAESIK